MSQLKSFILVFQMVIVNLIYCFQVKRHLKRSMFAFMGVIAFVCFLYYILVTKFIWFASSSVSWNIRTFHWWMESNRRWSKLWKLYLRFDSVPYFGERVSYKWLKMPHFLNFSCSCRWFLYTVKVYSPIVLVPLINSMIMSATNMFYIDLVCTISLAIPLLYDDSLSPIASKNSRKQLAQLKQLKRLFNQGISLDLNRQYL